MARMRIGLLCLLLIGSGLTGAGQEIVFGTIQGTVTREGTTEPIPDAQVTVAISPAQARALLDAAARGVAGIPAELVQAARGVGAGRAGGPAAPPLTATTDASGRFSIKVPAGTVTVRVQEEGFFGPMVNGFCPPFATATATVSAQEPVTVSVAMVPGGTIAGRVTTVDGKPMAHGLVGVAQPGYRNGTPSLNLVDGKDADDRGEFRLGKLPPGSYYLLTIGKPPTVNGTAPPSGAREVPVNTFYPSATDITGASLITLRPGEDLAGMDLQQRTAFTFKVSGRVTSTLPPGSEVSAINQRARANIGAIFLLPKDGNSLPDAATINNGSVPANADGTFEVPNVAPGVYDLFARLPTSRGWGSANPPEFAASPFAFGRTTVEVRGADVENVSVVVSAGSDVAGHVLLGDTPTALNVRVSLQPDGSAADFIQIYNQAASFAPPIGADGSFTFPLMLPGHYRVQLAPAPPAAQAGRAQGAAPAATTTVPLPASAYLADIRQQGASVFDSGFTIGDQPIAGLDIVFKSDGATIEGAVMTATRAPAAGATVVLVPEAAHRRNPALYRIGATDRQGHFSIRAVPPGTYRVFAWDSILTGAYMNAEFLQKYEALGASLAVRPGTTASDLALTVISAKGAER